MSGTAGQTAPETTSVPPNSDAAKMEELRKELGIDETGEPVAESIEPEPTEPATEPEPAAKQPYEELERNYGNVQKALKEAKDRARASDERLAGIMELVNRSRTQREPEAKKDEPKLPDKLEDPIGYYDARIAQLEAQLQETRTGTQLTADQLRAREEEAYLGNYVVQAENQIRDPKFEGHKADYDEAIDYLKATRAAELHLMYPDDSPYAHNTAQQNGYRSAAEFKNAIFANDVKALTRQAFELRMHPAAYFYQLSLSRGYTPKANGKAANGEALADKAAAAIAATKKGLKASATLSGDTGGRKSAYDMTLADLADMFIEDPEMADKIFEQQGRMGKLGALR